MKSYLPVRASDYREEGSLGRFVKILIEYMAIRLIARYSDELLSLGARLISYYILPGRKRKKRKF